MRFGITLCVLFLLSRAALAQPIERELADRLSEHLLLVGRRQVEQVAGLSARLAHRPRQPLRGGERAARPRGSLSGGPARLAQQPDGRLAQSEAVDRAR